LGGHKIPRTPIAPLAPDLAVEIISRSNTREEMERKLGEYFQAGVRLVWYVYPAAREARIYTGPDRFTSVSEDQSIDGGQVIPGFSLSLGEFFAEPGPGD
jgi:Uma2 family endonuclease